MSNTIGYRIGLPAWAFPGWRGRYFPAGNGSALASYANVFNTVEANTTFYRIPDEKTVAAWAEALSGTDFRMCFKLPRTVTHERAPSTGDLARFVSAIEPLAPWRGPVLLQFPASVGPGNIDVMSDLIARLPSDYRCLVEVRHDKFFSSPELLETLFDDGRHGRVVMDTRPLFEGDPDHPDVRAARHEKPDVPVLPNVYNNVTMVRLVLHPDLVSNERYIRQWAARVADNLDGGIETYMMIHCPNNLYCPLLAEQFHETLRQQPATGTMPALPAWPVPQQSNLL